MTDSTEQVSTPRQEIDSIDTEILALLNRRAEIALRVGAAKSVAERSLCDPKREVEVIERLKSANPGPLDEKSIENIFQRVIEESLQLQQHTYSKELPNKEAEPDSFSNLKAGTRVAFQGEPGSFSEEAVQTLLDGKLVAVATETFEELFAAIDDGKADMILSPLENSLVGSVHRCYDLLLSGEFSIVGEVILPISHYIVSNHAASFESIRTVESHPVALAQCERLFAAYPHLEKVAATDTAGSIKRVIESEDPTRAALGAKRAAEIYDGKILRAHVEDDPENYTRFALLSRKGVNSGEGNKISLIVRLKHQPGSLHSALRPFVRRGINLQKIESRPIKGSPGDFNFYFDLIAPTNESELKSALDEIDEHADEVIFLGRYSTIRKERQ